MVEPDSQAEVIHDLAGRLRRLERARPPVQVVDHCVPTGLPVLDTWLPAGGMTPGLVIEWLAADDGLGSTTLALRLMRQTLAAQGVPAVEVPMFGEHGCTAEGLEATDAGGSRSIHRDSPLTGPVLVVVDSRGMFYAPEAVRLGIGVEHLLVLRPDAPQDVLWSCEQSLRSTGVAGSVCWLERISGLVYRRIKLAAETGGGIHHIIRPSSHRGDPSWADVRLLVEAADTDDSGARSTDRTARVELVYARGRGSGGHFECVIDGQNSR
jgi:hypothetical protein